MEFRYLDSVMTTRLPKSALKRVGRCATHRPAKREGLYVLLERSGVSSSEAEDSGNCATDYFSRFRSFCANSCRASAAGPCRFTSSSAASA